MEMEQIPNVLACDCGNSAIKIGWVTGDIICETQRILIGEPGGLGAMLRELWDKMPAPKNIVASSVNPVGLKALEAAAMESIGQRVTIVGIDTPNPIDISPEIKNPEAVGVDRLCVAAAAYEKLGVGCVVVDFGTAITVDCVSEKGLFLGGAILPGLQMSVEALSEKTAALPSVKLRQPDWTFGRNTDEAIVGGIIYGIRGGIRQLSEGYATELGIWPLIIVTGGDAKMVFPNPGEDGLVQACVDDLALRGIAIAFFQMLIDK